MPHHLRAHQPHHFPAAAHSANGAAPYQHDRHLIHHLPPRSLYLVADGHGQSHTGHIVSQHIVDTFPALLHRHASRASQPHAMLPALTAAVLELDRSAIQTTSAARLYAGSTLCALLRVHHLVYCVNVGDSRALLLRSDAVKQLSVDHRCDLPRERHRIERAGGFIVGGMLNGYISMSRAIGDDDLKAHRNITRFPHMDAKPKRFGEELFVAEPDVHCFFVDVHDLVCVVASDGVWNKLGNQQVMKLVRRQIAKRMSAECIAKHIVNKAVAKGSNDNITALVVFLWPYDHVYDALFSSRLRRPRLAYDASVKRVDSSHGSDAVHAEALDGDENGQHWGAVGGRRRYARRPHAGRLAGVRERLVDAWQSRSLSTLY